MSNSALYSGRVVHRRHFPKQHRLSYGVFSLLLDLDELRGLRLRLLGVNKPGLMSFWESDHGDGSGSGLRAQVAALLREHGLGFELGRVQLLCYPRMLGYVFNPLSVYYCHDAAGGLRAIVYEVANTHGERQHYVLPALASRGLIEQKQAKTFYVSPFLPMDCEYRFLLRPPGERLRLLIRESQGGKAVLDAWFSGERRALTDRQLLAQWLRHPLMTLKVILGIHFEALRLWLKGLPVYRHQPKHEAAETPPRHPTPEKSELTNA